MADDQEDAPHAASAESLAYLEDGDAVADELARRRAVPRSADPETQTALDALTQPQLERLTRIYRTNTLPPAHHLALVRLIGSGRADAMRDDEAVERARAPAREPVDVLAGSELADIIDETMAWGALPSVPIYIPTRERGAQELLRLKPGAIIALIGGTGGGKTSLALEMYRCHARWTGPAAFFGLELNLPETGARLAGQHHQAAWLDAASLTRAELEDALAIPRAHVFGRMGLADIEARLDALRARYGDAPLFVVIDYAQILLDDVTERLAFAAVLERVRKMVQRTRVIAVLTSQSSRAGSRDLRAGEKLGKETEDAGAESAQLERMAYVTLAIGGDAEHDGHGWYPRDLSIGKSRMGTGDVVVPVSYHGISGRFAWAGEPEVATKARARKADEREQRERAAVEAKAETRVIEYLRTQRAPVSRRQVEDDIGGKREHTRQAVLRLRESGVVVDVGHGAKRGWHPPVALASSVPGSTPSTGPNRPQPAPNAPRDAGPVQVNNRPGPLLGGGPVDIDRDRTQSTSTSGPVEQDQETEWTPSPQCRTFAEQRGIDIAPLVAAVHAGPPVRDPDAVLMAAMVRVAMSKATPDATGAPQRGFLGFGPSRPRGKP